MSFLHYLFVFKDATSTSNAEIFVYCPHIRSVREMCFHPANNDLVSCGVDGTLRRADFNTCVFDEVSKLQYIFTFQIRANPNFECLKSHILIIENIFNKAMKFSFIKHV